VQHLRSNSLLQVQRLLGLNAHSLDLGVMDVMQVARLVLYALPTERAPFSERVLVWALAAAAVSAYMATSTKQGDFATVISDI